MPGFVMILLMAAAIASVACSSSQDLMSLMDSDHNFAGSTFGFASVTAFASKCSFAAPEPVLALVLVTVANQIRTTFKYECGDEQRVKERFV